MYPANRPQLDVEGIGVTGVIPHQDEIKIFTPVDFSDARSFLRSIRSLRRIVPPTIHWIIDTLARAKAEVGLPNFRISKGEIHHHLTSKFTIRPNDEADLTSFVERVNTIFFCICNNVSIRRFNRAGFTSNWIENLSESDTQLVNQNSPKFQAVPNPRASHHDRYFTKNKQNTKKELSTGLTHNDDADMKQKAEPVHGWGKTQKVAGWGTKTFETKTQHVDGWGEKQPAMDKNADALGRWMSKSESLPTSSWSSSKVPDTQGTGKPQSKNQASSCSMGKPNSKIASSSKQGIPKQVNEPSNSSIMGKPKPETSFNEKFHKQLDEFRIFFAPSSLPTSWQPKEGSSGGHVLNVLKEGAMEKAVSFAIGKLKQLKREELEEDEYSDDDDDDDSFEIDRPFDDVVPASSYMSERELKQILTLILNEDFIWDIGLQMRMLRDQNPKEDMKKLTSRCYCPCGRTHKYWLRNNDVSDIIDEKYCDNDVFEDINDFMRHVSAKALDNEPVHIGLWHYMQTLYGRYTKALFKKKKVRDTIRLPVVTQSSRYDDVNLFYIER